MGNRRAVAAKMAPQRKSRSLRMPTEQTAPRGKFGNAIHFPKKWTFALQASLFHGKFTALERSRQSKKLALGSAGLQRIDHQKNGDPRNHSLCSILQFRGSDIHVVRSAGVSVQSF